MGDCPTLQVLDKILNNKLIELNPYVYPQNTSQLDGLI